MQMQMQMQKPLAAAIGVFDGVHRGHQALLRRVTAWAGRGAVPAAVTFRENPKRFFARSPDEFEGDIFSLDQKLEALAEAGVELAILIDFSRDFSRLGGRAFLGLLLERFPIACLAVGAGFRCGRGRDTGAGEIAAFCRERGVAAEVVPPVEAAGGVASSSRARRLIGEGDLRGAAEILGRAVEIDLRGLEWEWEWGKIPGGRRFDAAGAGRVTPPPGRYRAPRRDRPGEAMVVEIDDDGGVLVPSPETASEDIIEERDAAPWARVTLVERLTSPRRESP